MNERIFPHKKAKTAYRFPHKKAKYDLFELNRFAIIACVGLKEVKLCHI